MRLRGKRQWCLGSCCLKLAHSFIEQNKPSIVTVLWGLAVIDRLVRATLNPVLPEFFELIGLSEFINPCKSVKIEVFAVGLFNPTNES
jgi:hypothetical protein